MKCINDIQTYINGKTADDIYRATASGVLSFDKSKYRLVKSVKTISGYVSDFTDNYKKEMEKIIPSPASRNVYNKLDVLLAEGYELAGDSEESLYPDMKGIFYGTGKSKVKVYYFLKPDDIDGADERQILVSDGELVKGSLSMALNRSDNYEMNAEEILERQDYAMDLFNMDRILAAYVTTVLHDYDDDIFYTIVDTIYDLSKEVLKKIPEFKTKGSRYGDILISKSLRQVSTVLFDIAAGNNDFERALKKFIRKSSFYSITQTRNIIIAGIKDIVTQELEGNIVSFKNFVETFPSGSFPFVVTVAGAEMEVADFILKNGNKNDFYNYMEISADKNARSKDDESAGILIDDIYEKSKGIGTHSPLSRKYINNFVSMFRYGDFKRLQSCFTDAVCGKEKFEFDLMSVIKAVFNEKGDRIIKVNDILHIIQSIRKLDDLNSYLDEICNNKVLRAYRSALYKEEEGMDFMSALEDEMSVFLKKNTDDIVQYDIENKQIVVPAYIGEFRTIVKIDMDETVYRKVRFSILCKKIMEEIMQRGCSMLECDGITGTVKGQDGRYFIQFTDGELKSTKILGMVSSELYENRMNLSKLLKDIHELYIKAKEIKESGDKYQVAHFFEMPYDLSVSPDKCLNDLLEEMFCVRVGIQDVDSVNTYIIDDSDVYVECDDIKLLQRMIRETYCEFIKKNGHMLSSECPNLLNLFQPEAYCISNGLLADLPPCYGGGDGKFYVGNYEVGFSQNLLDVAEEIRKEEESSMNAMADYRDTVTYERTNNKDLTQEKIMILRNHVQNNDVIKKHLFDAINNIQKRSKNDGVVNEILCNLEGGVESYKDYMRNK